MGQQSLSDYIWRNAYEVAALAVLLVLAYILQRRTKERMWLFVVVAAAMRLLATAANLSPYPTAIFPMLWVMYHGAPVVAVAGLIDAVVRSGRPRHARSPDRSALPATRDPAGMTRAAGSHIKGEDAG